jgi:hypothetical protein
VHVLRRPLKFSKCRNGMPRLGGEFVVDFQENGFVALNDQWTIGHA